MPYNLTLDIPSNRAVVERLREMDEWIDLRPQYVATDIQPDHFGDRMLVGGYADTERRFLQSGTNNRNTPYNFFATMATPSAGSLKSVVKKVGHTVKPVAKFTYNEIIKPVAKELKKEGVKLAKEMLREAIRSALTGDSGAPPSYADSFNDRSVSHQYAPPSYAESFGHPTTGRGRKPRGKGRKPKGGTVSMILSDDDVRGKGHSGGNVFPSATSVKGSGSGGKFNLKKALKSSNSAVGHFMTEKVAPVAKTIGVELGRELIPVAFEAVGAEFGVPPQISGAVGRVVARRALSEKNTGVRGGKKAVACGGKADGRQARALIVKRIMKEKGLKMIEASKYVKAHGLYKP